MSTSRSPKLADDRTIFALATEYNAPAATISILQALPDAASFARRLDEVGEVEFRSVHGGGIAMAGHIHAISLALHIFGNGVRHVQAMGETELQTVHLDRGDRGDRRSRGVALNCDVGQLWHCAFHVSAYGPNGAIHSPPLNQDMLEAVAIAEAARAAQQSGQPATVESP